MMTPIEKLRYHVTGAIERGEKTAIVGEEHRLKRLADGDPNAPFETNEIDEHDLSEGGDGIVYAGTKEEAADVRSKIHGKA